MKGASCLHRVKSDHLHTFGLTGIQRGLQIFVVRILKCTKVWLQGYQQPPAYPQHSQAWVPPPVIGGPPAFPEASQQLPFSAAPYGSAAPVRSSLCTVTLNIHIYRSRFGTYQLGVLSACQACRCSTFTMIMLHKCWVGSTAC